MATVVYTDPAARIAALDAIIASKDQEIDQERKMVQAAQALVDGLRKEVTDKTAELKVQTDEVARLTAELKSRDQHLADVDQKLVALQQKADDNRKERTTMWRPTGITVVAILAAIGLFTTISSIAEYGPKVRAAFTGETIVVVNKDGKIIQGMLAGLPSPTIGISSDDKGPQVTVLTTQVTGLERQVSELKSKLTAAEKQRDELAPQLVAANTELDTLRPLKVKVSTLETDLKTAQENLLRATRELADIKGDYTNVKVMIVTSDFSEWSSVAKTAVAVALCNDKWNGKKPSADELDKLLAGISVDTFKAEILRTCTPGNVVQPVSNGQRTAVNKPCKDTTMKWDAQIGMCSTRLQLGSR